METTTTVTTSEEEQKKVLIIPQKKTHLFDMVKKPLTALASVVWDEKSGTFSTSRIQFILTSVFGAYLIWDVRCIIVDAYRANREIPNLEWYILAIVAYIATGPAGYGLSKIGSKYDGGYSGSRIPEDQRPVID